MSIPDKITHLLIELQRHRSGLKRGEIEIPGSLRYAYLAGGLGEPLLLHGFGANKDNFTPVARLLTPHYRVVAPDHIGFGGVVTPRRCRLCSAGTAAACVHAGAWHQALSPRRQLDGRADCADLRVALPDRCRQLVAVGLGRRVECAQERTPEDRGSGRAQPAHGKNGGRICENPAVRHERAALCSAVHAQRTGPGAHPQF